MGVTDRLVTTGGSDTSPGIGPKVVSKNDDATKTSQSQFGTGPSDVITQESEFHTEASGRFDARGSRIVVVTLSSFGGTDSFTITFQEADGTYATTAAIVRGTNAAASDVQTAVRAVLTGTDLTTVAGDTDAGPYTITFNDAEYFSRRFPRIVSINGTGCTGAVSQPTDGSQFGTKRYLGETKYEGTTELVGPTLGTITVTDTVDEVQTFTPGSGVDGGSVYLEFRRGRSGAIAFDADKAVIQAAVDNMFGQAAGLVGGTDSPVVTVSGTEVVTLDLGDMSTADTCKITYAGHESSLTLTYDAALTAAAVQLVVDSATVTAGLYTVARTSNLVYTLTKQSAGASGAFSVTSIVGFTPKGTGGYTLGFLVTTTWSLSAGQTLWVFTYSRGKLNGMPIRGGIRVGAQTALTDGGVADTAVLTVTTPGVLGSASAAYTEQATVGDSIFCTAVNDTTGVSYDGQKDAASPAVVGSVTGLPPGTYTFIARTVADKALSAPSTKAFTVA
jgi:hypothetical protein